MMEYRFLRFVPFVELTRWDYNSYFKEKSIKSQYEIVELLEVLKDLTKERQFTIDDKVEYSEPTISSKLNTITARKTGLGKEFKVKKRVLIKPNDLVIAKMHTQNGLFAISNDEFASTNTFIPLEIKGNIDKNYLLSLLKTTLARLEKFDSVNRETYSVDEILSLHLPLPPLATQKALVEKYTAKTTEAKQKEELASEHEKSIEEYLITELGIEVQKKEFVESKYKYLRFVGFDSLERWDLWNEPRAVVKYKYPCVKFENVLSISSGQFLPKSKQIEGEYKVYGGNGYNGNHNEFCFKGKRILIGRVGEYCGNVHLVDGQYWVTDNAFYSNLINKNFTLEYLEIVLRFANLNQFRVLSAQPSISQKNIAKIQLPIPPLEVQNRIATHITNLKEQIKALRLEAKTLQAEAKQEFEMAVFG